MARIPPEERYQHAVNQTFARMLTHVVRAIHTEFTYDEVLELTCPPSMRETLKLAVSYAQPLERGYSALSFDATPIEKVSFHFEKQHLLPNQPLWQGNNISPGLREKFNEWLAARLKVGVDYGRVKAVLEQLQVQHCNPAQQRYYLPSIHVLWQQDEYLRKLVDKHAAHKRLRNLPMLTYELRVSIVLAMETLSVHATLGATHTDAKVTVRLDRGRLSEGKPVHQDEYGLEFQVL